MAETVEAFDGAIDRILPATDDMAHTHFTISGVWIAGGAWATDKTVEWLEKGGGSELEIAATVGATCLATLVGGVLWRQGWRAKGETEA